jgi:RHS repeat-associated protein
VSTSAAAGAGSWTETSYDTDGRPTLEKTWVGDALVRQVEYGYDGTYDFLDEQIVTDSLGRATRETYDEDGNVLTRTLAYGTGGAATTTFVYDGQGRLTSLTDPNTNETTWDYTGPVVTMTDTFSNDVVSTYDGYGRLISVVDRNNLKRAFEYDVKSRLVEETWYATDHTTVVDTLTFTYAVGTGLLSSATSGAGTYTFTYNAAGQLIEVDEPFGVTLEFGYDEAGNRTLVEDSFGGAVESEYDAFGQLIRRVYTDGGGTELRVDRDYDDLGQLVGQLRYSDEAGTTLVAESEYAYDDEGRLTALTHDSVAEDPIEYTWDYDGEGQLVGQADHGDTYSYTYDDQGQLTGDGTDTWDYDAGGTRDGGDYDAGTNNQLDGYDGWAFSYDDEGNQEKKSLGLSAETWTYGYDHRNQLSWVEKRATDGGTLQLRAEFEYDAFGNRLQKKVDANGDGDFLDAGDLVQRYAYDGWNPAKPSPVGNENWDVLLDLDGSNARTAAYLRGDVIDELFARADDDPPGAPVPYWYLTDHLGSVRDVLDSDGDLAATLAYDAYGKIVSDPDAEVSGRYAFTGREVDREVKLQYNRARYYDAETGRWISQDPMKFDAGDSNLYRYVNNRPTQVTDASGLFAIADHALMIQVAVIEWSRAHIQKDEKLREKIRNIVVSSNLRQDMGPNYNREEVHFTRGYRLEDENAETNEKAAANRVQRGMDADKNYINYAREEHDIFLNANGKRDPQEALEALGRLSHSWQDFFGHAVRVDQGGENRKNTGGPRKGMLRSEDSQWPGFAAFSEVKFFLAVPYNHEGLIPASYQPLVDAEHPPTSEPVSRKRGDGAARYSAALKYTVKYVGQALNRWYGTYKDALPKFAWRAPVSVDRVIHDQGFFGHGLVTKIPRDFLGVPGYVTRSNVNVKVEYPRVQ